MVIICNQPANYDKLAEFWWIWPNMTRRLVIHQAQPITEYGVIKAGSTGWLHSNQPPTLRLTRWLTSWFRVFPDEPAADQHEPAAIHQLSISFWVTWATPGRETVGKSQPLELLTIWQMVVTHFHLVGIFPKFGFQHLLSTINQLINHPSLIIINHC